DLLKFTDNETLQALTAITKGHPSVVALERAFSGTPRGKALINRINADPTLAGCRVRIVSSNEDVVGTAQESPHEADAKVVRSGVDQRGTRRAQRFKIDGYGSVVVEGKAATLQDLSTFGAQIILTTALKPNQRVEMMLSDDKGVVRFNAQII